MTREEVHVVQRGTTLKSIRKNTRVLLMYSLHPAAHLSKMTLLLSPHIAPQVTLGGNLGT